MRHCFLLSFFLFILFCLNPSQVNAQRSAIKGVISDQKGEPVPFASIGVEKQPAGTMANQEGRYQLDLKPGTYKIYFHCIGYQTQLKEIEVGQGFTEINISMNEQSIQMKEVTIAVRNEDPAYGIMRKAIARAKINKLLVNEYKARVYIRGSGRILEIPFLFRGMAKKEGFDENTVFFTETLENLEFKQPNTYKEVVIAARSTAGDVKIDQRFIKGDLYNANYGSTVSPLSPSAFNTYKFQYLGAFTDRGHEVFKIKVIPKIKGEKIWEGEISIIDNLWCIHSAHLEGNVEGIEMKLNHTYAPQEGIWMPVQLRQDFKGKLLGIGFEATYNSSISQYKLVKNEKLYADFKALEQKLDEKVSAELQKPAEKVDLKAREKEDKKLIRQMAKAYAKEKLKEKLGLKKKEPKAPPRSAFVRSDMEYRVDSNALKKDSAYWEENRDVPLTVLEVRSFHKLDSIRVVEEKKDSAKTGKKGNAGSSVMGFIMGNSYWLGKKDSLKRSPTILKFFSPLSDIQFNAVEGYAFNTSLWLKTYLRQSESRIYDDRPYLQFGPTVRYSFGRNKLLGMGTLQFGTPLFEVQVEGGTRMRQLNGANPIPEWLNSLTALLASRNYLKQYEEDFIEIKAIRKLTGRLELTSGFLWANRIPVRNTKTKGFWGKTEFEPNAVQMPFASAADTGRTILFSWSGRMDWFPVLESSLYNGRQNFYSSSSPRVRFEWEKAIPKIAGSGRDFTRLTLSYLHEFKVNEQSGLALFGRASGFVGTKKMGQMDAAQIIGNQTWFLTGNHLESFRNLNFYDWSSDKAIFEAHAEWEHKRLLLGWLFKKKTWQEVVLAKGMANPDQPYFYELGYGIDQLFRFVRLEVVRSQWQNSTADWSIRVGFQRSFSIGPKTFDRKAESAGSIRL